MFEQTLIKLLNYEVETLRQIENITNGIAKVLCCNQIDSNLDIPCLNYDILYLVLDEMKIPSDREYPRDRYNNAYFDLIYYSKKKVNKDFLDKCIKIYKENLNENKKKVW